jgi:hypothetical protein
MIRLLSWMLAAYRFRRECRRAGLPRDLAGRIRQAERMAISRALLIDPTDEAAAQLAGDTASVRCFGDALVDAGLAKKRVLESGVLTMAQADRPSIAERCDQGRAGDAERVTGENVTQYEQPAAG